MKNKEISDAIVRFKYNHSAAEYGEVFDLLRVLEKYINKLEGDLNWAQQQCNQYQDAYSRLRYPDNTGQ